MSARSAQSAPNAPGGPTGPPAPQPARSEAPGAWWLVPAGAAISFLGAICGIGGGLFVVPLLVYALGTPMRVAVATAVVHVLATAAAATAAELVRAPAVFDPLLVGLLALGAFVGASLGFALSRRISSRWLGLAFACAACAAGVRLLLEDPSAAETTLELGQRVELGAAAYAYALLAGALGGALTPLLGLGGGIVFVPALHLALPELGFNAARASSLAVVMVSAARSALLYAREGSIQRTRAVQLGLGAAIGAVLGVHVAHEPGALAYSGPLLGFILLGVALRFGFDFWRTARAARA